MTTRYRQIDVSFDRLFRLMQGAPPAQLLTTGPVYLRSSSNKLPDLVVALNRRDLAGASDFSRLAGSQPRQLMLTLLRGEEAYYLLLQ